jgi:ComF family protein
MAVISHWITACGFTLLAPRCLVCSERGSARCDLCLACALALPWNDRACARCGLLLPVAAAACGRCLRRPPPFERTRAAFRYVFPVDRLLPRFKFHGDLAAGALLGRLMAGAVIDGDLPQALVPVPLHRGRLRERGYDQARELALGLGRILGVPVFDLVERRHATQAQTTLGAAARRRNVRGAFECRAGAMPAHVALVDDVMTTGATLSECARVLRGAGVARIEAWAVARAGA